MRSWSEFEVVIWGYLRSFVPKVKPPRSNVASSLADNAILTNLERHSKNHNKNILDLLRKLFYPWKYRESKIRAGFYTWVGRIRSYERVRPRKMLVVLEPLHYSYLSRANKNSEKCMTSCCIIVVRFLISLIFIHNKYIYMTMMFIDGCLMLLLLATACLVFLFG